MQLRLGDCALPHLYGWRQLIGQRREWGGDTAASGIDLFLSPQELVLETAQRRARLEGLRYAAVLKQQAAQHSTALLHWGALWRQLSSPCGAWALRWAGLDRKGILTPSARFSAQGLESNAP